MVERNSVYLTSMRIQYCEFSLTSRETYKGEMGWINEIGGFGGLRKYTKIDSRVELKGWKDFGR